MAPASKKFRGIYTLEKFSSGMHYIRIANARVLAMAGESKRLRCTLNGQIEIHCALMPKKEGGFFINIGSTVCKKLNVKAGAQLEAAFAADGSTYQFEMPRELQEVLRTDREANTIFQTLTPGNQRGLIYLVTQVKSIDKRIERALTISQKLKDGITAPRVILK